MAHTTPTARRDIYAEITDKIIAAIEQNPGEPVLPWHRSGFRPVIPKNAATGNDYRGVNILSLWVTALERGYESGVFATYKQWSALGAQVRKGETAAPIVFYRSWKRSRTARGTARTPPKRSAWRAAIGCSPPSRSMAFHCHPRCRPTRLPASPPPRLMSPPPVPR